MSVGSSKRPKYYLIGKVKFWLRARFSLPPHLSNYLTMTSCWFKETSTSVIEARGAVWGAKDPTHTKRKARRSPHFNQAHIFLFIWMYYECIFFMYGCIIVFFFVWMYSFLCIDVLWMYSVRHILQWGAWLWMYSFFLYSTILKNAH